MIRRPPKSTPFPSTTLFRSRCRLERSSVPACSLPKIAGRKLWAQIHGAAAVQRAAPERVPPQTCASPDARDRPRSEEHTSELQSQSNLVCRLLLVKKKNFAE